LKLKSIPPRVVPQEAKRDRTAEILMGIRKVIQSL
jgi:hypothetical protein